MSRPRQTLRLEPLEHRLAPSSTQFAVIGDYGLASSPGEGKVAALVKSWNPDFIITVGDNNYPAGSAATIDANIGQYYHDYIGNYVGRYGAGSAVNRFFPTLGNHDWTSATGSPALPTPYLNYFTLPGNERYYTFTQGPVQFFAIDSGNGAGDGSDSPEPDGYSSTSVQAQWLQAQLAASTAQWKIVYFHHPAYSSGGLGSNPVMQWPFQQWGATAVMAGSDHDYERLIEGGIPYFVDGLGGESYVAFTGTPVAGSQVRYADNWGAMHVTASDTQIQFQFISLSGTVIDSYTIQAANSLPTVTVAATDATANEQNPTDTGTFTITRTGGTASPLTVNLAVGGTATNGVDDTTIPGSVTIPAGSSTTTVQVTPVSDGLPDGNETVTLSVAAGGGYNIGAANSATVTILDTSGSSTSATLVPAGSVWKYLDTGTDQGTAWRAPSFDDGGWKSGPAQLGYGDGDEATVVGYGPNASNKYITTYFRTSFSVADPAAVTSLALKLIRDDGAVVYLNGIEVYRNNMGTGAVAYNTLAPLSIGGADESTWYSATLNSAGLVGGTNVLAVEVHQASPDSSDISFDLELDATVTAPAGPPAPSTPRLTPASDNGLDNDDNITSVTTPTFVGTAPVGSTVKLYSDGTLVGTAVAADGTYSITSSVLADGTHVITATDADSSGSTSPASAPLSVTIDTTPPTAAVVAVTPDPRSTSVSSIAIKFNEVVSGLDLADLSLSFNGGPNLLTAVQTLVTADGVTWTLGNLDGLTAATGTYTLTLTAANSGITDRAGNALTAGASDTWRVVPVSIVDDGAAGFATAGAWKVVNGQGYQSDYHYQDKGTGSRTATWTFTGLTPGLYRVSATWVAAGSLATNAPFTVLAGGTTLGSVAVNQRVAPGDFADAGVGWKDLGGPYQIAGTSLTVRLTDKANGRVVADAVRIERLSPEEDAGGPLPAAAAAPLTQAELDAITRAALARWAADGVAVPAVAVRVADLPAGYLGAEGPSGILIDRTADGYGWFVDPTPADDREFPAVSPAGDLLAPPGTPAAGGIDLLTVVEHELGHVLGLPELDPQDEPHSLMTETLAPGERRLIAGTEPVMTAPAPDGSATHKPVTPATPRRLGTDAAILALADFARAAVVTPDDAGPDLAWVQGYGTTWGKRHWR